MKGLYDPHHPFATLNAYFPVNGTPAAREAPTRPRAEAAARDHSYYNLKKDNPPKRAQAKESEKGHPAIAEIQKALNEPTGLLSVFSGEKLKINGVLDEATATRWRWALNTKPDSPQEAALQEKLRKTAEDMYGAKYMHKLNATAESGRYGDAIGEEWVGGKKVAMFIGGHTGLPEDNRLIPSKDVLEKALAEAMARPSPNRSGPRQSPAQLAPS